MREQRESRVNPWVEEAIERIVEGRQG